MIGNPGNIDQTKSGISPEIPFYEFFDYLQKSGFAVEISDYQESAQFLKETDLNNPEEVRLLKYRIAPIICRNAEEQEKFYLLFDGYVSDRKQEFVRIGGVIREISDNRERRKKRSLKKAFYFIPFLVIPGLIFFLLRRDPYPFSWSRDQDIRQGIPASFQSINPYEPRKSTLNAIRKFIFGACYDSARIQATWDFGDGTPPVQMLNPQHTFHSQGTFPVRVTFISKSGNRQFYEAVRVCGLSPDLSRLARSSPAGIAYFLVKSDSDHDRKLVWEIGNDPPVVSAKDSITHWFKEPGDYLIKCRYPDQTPECGATKKIRITESNDYILTGRLAEYSPVIKKTPRNLFYLLNAGLILSGFLVSWLLVLKKRKSQKEKLRLQGELFNEPVFTGKLHPYEMPFRNRDELIHSTFAQRWSNQLIRIIRPHKPWLHLKRTIRETIRNEGLFTPVYESTKTGRRFVFLIDAGYRNSVRVNLFSYVARMLVHFQVDLDIWYFDKEPLKVYNDQNPEKIDIRKIRERHYQSVLVIWGDGFSFLEPGKAEIHPFLKEVFGYWQQRILVTPVGSIDWSVNEKILSSFFLVFPADIPGLVGVVSTLNENVLEYKPFENQYVTYRSKLISFEDTGKLEDYFGDDRMLFQVVCALAVYPRVRWEILITVLHALCPEKLSYSNLLKIARISWVQSGEMSSRLRLELLKKLEVPNEMAVREGLIRLLEESPVNDREFAADEKKMQLIVNKFVLYAHDPVKYAAYQAQEKEFLYLYANDELSDVPLRVYLEKKDPDYPVEDTENGDRVSWETPVQQPGRPGVQVELGDYLAQKAVKLSNRSPLPALYAASLALIVLTLFFSAWNWLRNDRQGFLERMGLFQTREEPPDQWFLKMENNPCFALFRGEGPVMAEIGPADMGPVFETGSPSDPYLVQKLTGFTEYSGRPVDFALINNAGLRVELTSDVQSDTLILKLSGPACMPDTGEPFNSVFIVYSPEIDKVKVDNLRDILESNNFAVAGISSNPEVSGNFIEVGPETDLNHESLTRLKAIVQSEMNGVFEFRRSEAMGIRNAVTILIGTPRDTSSAVVCPEFDGNQTWSVYFDFDKSTLRSDGQATLDRVLERARNLTSYEIIVSGHTDSGGTATYNLSISERMALSVMKYLLAKGVDAGKISTKGYGESRPKYLGTTNMGKTCNRRVDVEVIRLEDLQPADTECVEFRRLQDAIGQPDPARVCSLFVAGDEVCDFELISRFVNLRFLDTGGAPVRNLNLINRLRKLESLIYNTVLSNVTQRLTNLQAPVSRLPVLDVSLVSGLAALKQLRIINIGLANPESFKETKSLVELELVRNNLGDLTFLRNSGNLLFLTVTENNVSDLSPLGRLQSLTTVSLSNNRIEDVAPLSGLRNLRNLDLSNNSITDIRPLEKLQNLRSVNLKGNKIPVNQLRNLRQVFPELQIEADSTISIRITAPSGLRGN